MENGNQMKLEKDILNYEMEGSDSKQHCLSEFKKKYLVIYFYPKDETYFCRIQGHKFSNLLVNFNNEDADVIGISGGTGESKCKFSEKEKYVHLLLADNDYVISKAFNVYKKNGLILFPNIKVSRCTFILNHEKNIIKEWRDVNSDYKIDAERALSFIKQNK